MRWIAAFLFLLAASGAGAEPPAPSSEALPAVTFTQPDGQAFTLDGLKGRPALVNFWGTWCPPCREELPLLIKAYGKYGKQVAFVGLAVEDNAEFMGEFARAYKVPYAVAAGREAAISLMQALGNSKALMPFTVILDAEGRVVFSRAGLVSEKELERTLDPLLQSRAQ